MQNIKLQFQFKLVQGMAITAFRVNTTNLDQSQLDDMRSPSDPNLITGLLDLTIVLSTAWISVVGIGGALNAGNQASFNLTVIDDNNGSNISGKKVFDKDQQLVVNDNGKFTFKQLVKLPV